MLLFAVLAFLAPGEITDPVAARADPAQTYALYLPSSFTPDRAWPVLFCFDPAARGRVPVERFRAAAEKHGWIVAGSNNSRNGPFQPSLAAAQAMWNDIHERFPIDPKRRYTAGFSGGARVATSIALSTDAIAGVFAAGGGFPQPEPKRVDFAFFGAAGTEDFNWAEVRQIDADLDALGTPHRVVIFEGTHSWPPDAVCQEGIEWFELHAMRSGRQPRAEALINALFSERTARLEGLPPEREWLEASRLAADFKGLRDVAAYERRAAGLRASKEVERYLKSEKQEFERNLDYERMIGLVFRYPEQPDERMQVHNAIRTLRSKAAAKNDSAERRAARRVLAGAAMRLVFDARDQIEARKYEPAAFALAAAVEIQPERPGAWVELARVRALRGEDRKALEALKQAVARGFKDSARLQSEPAFERLRRDPAFQNLLVP